MKNFEIFNKQKYLHLSNIIPLELCKFLTHAMLRESHNNYINNIYSGDPQVENSLAVLSHDLWLETVQERIWPFIENIVQEELIPTYSYARLYTNGNILEKHTDRPSCEISVTIQLGRSHHYSWPFFAENKRFDLAEGDGVLYKGCDAEHWRETCAGPENYYSGQLFCHFVRANGPYAEFVGDKRWDNEIPFTRYRTLLMETK